jgi:hypothetical protein
MECKHCKNIFKTKSALNTHKKTAKYCLKIRDISLLEYKCESCKKMFSTLTNLNRHQKSCKVGDIISSKIDLIDNYKQEIIDLNKNNQQFGDKIVFLQEELNKKDLVIQKLQDKLENVAIKAVSRPITSNRTQINNYIQNMRPVTDELLLDNAQHLTIDHINKGPEGYAEYALEYPLKDSMLCSDYSRRKVKFKDNDGNVITDPEMTVLARKFFNSIKDKNKELICKSANELKERLGDDNVMDTVVKMFDYKSDIEKGSEGEKTEFHHDFVRQVCSKTIKD